MVRHTVFMALVAAWLLSTHHSVASAEDSVQWRVSHFDTLTNTQESSVFATEQEALTYKRTYEKVENLSKGGPAYINWKITKEPNAAKPEKDKAKDPKDGEKNGGDSLARLRAAKDVVALAMRSGSAEFANKELLLREAIDDYKQAVADTFRRIREFEKNLLGGTQEMQEARFREINALVDRYNRQANEFQAVMGRPLTPGYQPLPRFEAPASKDEEAGKPPQASARPADKPLVGRSWKVIVWKSATYAGLPLVITFLADGKAHGLYNGDTHEGVWSESDDTVTVQLDSFGANSSYRKGFTIRGKRAPDGSLEMTHWAQDIP